MSVFSTLKMYARRTPKLLGADRPLLTTRSSCSRAASSISRSLRGKPTLIVNTASKCGYTPQYEGLQALYERYSDRGLQMLGSPSADFADQEYDDADEIGAFCQKNYGVTFPLTERTSVRADPSPLWNDLSRQPGSGPPVWNFTKYLIGADGKLIARWPTKVKPEDPKIVAAIESALPAERVAGLRQAVSCQAAAAARCGRSAACARARSGCASARPSRPSPAGHLHDRLQAERLRELERAAHVVDHAGGHARAGQLARPLAPPGRVASRASSSARSASRLATRSPLVAKRASDASSGAPITSHRAANWRSLPTATTSSPSPVAYSS